MLKARLWITEDTLVRTTDGWEPAANCSKLRDMIGYDESTGTYISVSVKEFNKFDYSGIITTNNSDSLSAKCFQSLIDETGKSRLLNYEGKIINIVTENNTIITSSNEGETYSILSCQTAK